MEHEQDQVNEKSIWLQDEQEDFLGVNDASMFYADFPSLPDFPCMSSSSSSSSTPAPVKTITCSSSSSSTATSSSAASWAVLKYDAEEDVDKINYPEDAPLATLTSTASMEIPQPPELGLDGGVGDCMDPMDTFGYMDLVENNDFFDPASIFQDEEYPLEEYPQEQRTGVTEQEEHAIVQQLPRQEPEEDQIVMAGDNNNGEVDNNNGEVMQEDQGISPVDEMSTVFLEWLKSNKDNISANDLRSVKLKKATIECAARRLGGGKEAMKQLLKLILEWVQTSHLQNKRRWENSSTPPSNFLNQFQDPCQNPNSNSNQNNSFGPESNTCFNQSPWIPPPPYVTDPATIMAAPPPFPPQIIGHVGDPYSYNPPATEYHMLESAHSWPASQFAVAPHYNQSFGDNNLHPTGPPVTAAAFAGYGGNQYPYQYFHGPGDKLMRLGPSATKEARKKRMARQRRSFTHHRYYKNNQHLQNQSADPLARLGSDNCTGAIANPANWVYWASLAGGAAPMAPAILTERRPGQPVMDGPTAMQTQNYHQSRVSSTDHRRQGWKPEKNLRFLLQKVLKQSDVGSLGRIVLPKKEAETHLPELEARDGISIAIEDIGTSRVWNMRYRYWPNNKSRMYLLENTGDFVRANGLQEGDFIVLYSDVKCGKFMIRGVKVRQGAAGTKTENNKKAGKSQKNQHGNATTTAAGANALSSPNTQPQKTEKNSKIK